MDKNGNQRRERRRRIICGKLDGVPISTLSSSTNVASTYDVAGQPSYPDGTGLSGDRRGKNSHQFGIAISAQMEVLASWMPRQSTNRLDLFQRQRRELTLKNGRHHPAC